MNKKTKMLVTCGIFIALGTVLSLAKIPFMFGGSVTLFSMVPLCIICYTYGIKTGAVSAFAYSVLQILTGMAFSSSFFALTGRKFILMLLLDYLLAYTVISLCGLFSRKIHRPAVGISIGALCVTLLRYFCHIFSGFILYADYAEWFFSEECVNIGLAGFGENMLATFSGDALALVYSAAYNGLYMVPEIILTVIGCAVAVNIPAVKKHLFAAD